MQTLLSNFKVVFSFVLECVLDIVNLITNTPLLLFAFVPGFLILVVNVVKRLTKK